MKTMRPWRGMAVLGVWLLLAACGSDSSSSGNGGDADAGGDATGDTPTSDTPVNDSTPDVPIGQGRQWITTACTAFDAGNVTFPSQTTDGRAVRLIVEAVDFRTSTFVVRNVSNADFTFLTDVRRLCANNVQSQCTDTNYTVPAGARVAIHMARVENATQPANSDTEVFVWGNANAFTLDAAEGEVGVRDNSNSDAVPEMFENFVIWGADPASASQSGRDEAASVGLWASDDAGAFVTTGSSDVGIVATGDVTDPADWVVVGGDCFPADLLQ